MSSLTQVSREIKTIVSREADQIARAVNCVKRQRTFSGSSLVQMAVFGFGSQPDLSLEALASQAAVCGAPVSDTGVHKRFTPEYAELLYQVLQRVSRVVMHAQSPSRIEVLTRFTTVVIEDSSTISLPEEAQKVWKGCGGRVGRVHAGVKLHTRLDLVRGQLWGPLLTASKQPDRASPLKALVLPEGSLFIADLGYFDLQATRERFEQGSWTLTRRRAHTSLWWPNGQQLDLCRVLPSAINGWKELRVLVGKQRHPMRLILQRVPLSVGKQRRARLRDEAAHKPSELPEESYILADWTILLTDAPADLLTVSEALALLRERWQIELVYKVWKSDDRIDEWRTANVWRMLCELYAKLIAAIFQHWNVVWGAWDNPQRSWHKTAEVARKMMGLLHWALLGRISMRAYWEAVRQAMSSGCSMNTRAKHPHSVQVLIAASRSALDP